VEGQEIWQKEYDISGLKPGKHNFLVRARDAAGNETIDGPYNIIADPRAGLPQVRAVYPDANAIIRQDTDFLGVASGQFGIDKVTVHLDKGPPVQAEGAEYWKYRISAFPQESTLANGSVVEQTLEEGHHVLYVTATDKRQTVGPELRIPFTYDKTPPVLEFAGIETGQLVTGNKKLKGLASDMNGIVSVEFSPDGGKTFSYLAFKKNSKVPGGVTFEVPFPTTKYADGQVFFQLRATDSTGLSTTQPYLLYIDNVKPVIEIISPAEGEDSFGTIKVTGRIIEAVGLSKFYYEWAGETNNIPIRPGDPYWDINLFISYQNRNPTLRIYAVDKSDNQTVLTRRFTDSRKAKTPAIQIDYPQSGLSSLSPDQSIFGQIAPGFVPESIIIEGQIEEIPAKPSFRIPPDMIAQGRSTLRLWAKSSDGTVGSPHTLRVNKPLNTSTPVNLNLKPSPIVINNYKPYDYIQNASITIQGHIAQVNVSSFDTSMDADILAELSNMTDMSTAMSLLESRINATGGGTDSRESTSAREEIPYAALTAQGGPFNLEYRIGPQNGWLPVTLRGDGSFELPVNMNAFEEGPVHLELRTLQRGTPAIPLYFPLNRARTTPEIQFVSPVLDAIPVNGTVTVSGKVHSYVPLAGIEFTTDGNIYTPVDMKSGFEEYEFAMTFDFTAMARTGGTLAFRVRDINNKFYETPLDAVVDSAGDDPKITFNKPLENELITDDLAITGIAQDDDAVYGVHWRLVKKESSTAQMFAWEEEGEKSPLSSDFSFIETNQSFEINIPLGHLSDGEWDVEVFGEDIYGVQGEVTTRTVRVSKSDPKVAMTEPVMTVYTHGVIYMRGTASDNNGIGGVWVSMDNGNTYQQAEGGENWQLSLNTALYNDGEYAVLLRARDRYGRETIDSAMLNIDNTPPSMVFEVPYDDADIGDTLNIAARILDNIEIQDIMLEFIEVTAGGYRSSFALTPAPVILEALDVSAAPLGDYNIRIVARDMAGNIAVASRNITKTTESEASEAAFFNPMPGEVHTGSINISGRTQGLVVPTEVQLWANREPLAMVPVDRYGFFYYKFPPDRIPEDGYIVLSSSYQTPSGDTVLSNEHPILYRTMGPIVSVESHNDGDIITGRPWLKGRAWMETPIVQQVSREDRRAYEVTKVLVSFDNGRTFRPAKGTNEWKFRLECIELGRGPLSVLVRAEFANGEIAIHRVIMTIDLDAPEVRTLDPQEDTFHRNDLFVYGTASEENAFESIMINLRPGDKALYMIPPFIQGLYIDATVFGATYFSVGMGITFFNDNVKLQGQWGKAPNLEDSRYPGTMIGAKLIANIYNLPFKYIFGPDWESFSMTWALGANFSYSSMEATASNEEKAEGQILGAVLAQWEFARITIPRFKAFSSYALFMEPALWFTPSDVDADRFVFRLGFGFRTNVF
jgi:hypothetical protein